MYQSYRNDGHLHSGRLTATSGIEGSTRGMRESPYYARSEAGRGDTARSIWTPSPNNSQMGRDPVDHPHTNDRRFAEFGDEGSRSGFVPSAPYTSQSERHRPSGGSSSRPHAMSVNGRDFDTPGSVRMESDNDGRSTFRRETRPSFNRAASFNGRFTSGPSLPNTPNEPPVRTRAERNTARRPPSPRRPTRQPSPTNNTPAETPRRSQGPLKSSFYIPGASSSSSRKQVHFNRNVAPSSVTPVSYPTLPPVDVEESTVPARQTIPAPVPVDLPPPPSPPPPPPSSSRSTLGLVAVILKAVRRLFRKRLICHLRFYPPSPRHSSMQSSLSGFLHAVAFRISRLILMLGSSTRHRKTSIVN
jgi:hypothetical protein